MKNNVEKELAGKLNASGLTTDQKYDIHSGRFEPQKGTAERAFNPPTEVTVFPIGFDIEPISDAEDVLPHKSISERYVFVSPGVPVRESNREGVAPKESFVRDINAKTDKGGGLRFNSGKLRYDLVDPRAHEDMVKVLTYGAEKYTVRDAEGNIINKGDDNWRRGFSWKSAIASLKRHIAALEKCEDYDQDTGLLHVSHAACNIHFLNAFYYIFPQGDDRIRPLFKLPKIGLDIDEVICGFLPAWMEKYGVETFPHSWFFDREIKQKFEDMRTAGELDDFYMNLKPLLSAEDLPFEPHCYITSRPVSKEVTEKWLDKHGFPTKKVYTVDSSHSKVQVAKESGIEIFIDDSYDNFLELNSNGIFTYLYTQNHNAKYDVGHMRLNSLHELPFLKK